MTGAIWRSWFVAALFGLHPMHVESVAWVSERKDVLSALLWLLALWSYVRYAQITRETSPIYWSCLKFYLLSLLLFVCALMSKPMAVTFPCALLLLDFWPLNRFKKDQIWPILLEKVPFLVLAAILSTITVSAQKAGGTIVQLADLSLSDRLENALVSYACYIGKLLFPTNLAVFYPMPAHWPLPGIICVSILLMGISIFAIATRKHQPYLLVGWLWFLGTLVPVIGLVQVGSQAMADRYSYIPSIGFFVALSWGIYTLTTRWSRQTVVLSCSAAVVLVLSAGLTWRQADYWRNSGTLFHHALAVTKDNVQAYWNLADYELKQGHADEALDLCQKAMVIRPDFAPINETFGLALCKTGHTDEGIMRIRFSQTLDPYLTPAYSDLADVFASQEKVEEAITEYREAIRLSPNYLPTYNRFGALLESSNHYDEAVKLFGQAVYVFPAYADAHASFALALAYKGHLNEAADEYRQAIRLNPALSKAYFGLALLLESKGQLDEAISQFKAGLKIEPNSPQIHNELGVIFGREGRMDEAISEFQEATNLEPAYAQAQTNLVMALKMQDQKEKQITPAKP